MSYSTYQEMNIICDYCNKKIDIAKKDKQMNPEDIIKNYHNFFYQWYNFDREEDIECNHCHRKTDISKKGINYHNCNHGELEGALMCKKCCKQFCEKPNIDSMITPTNDFYHTMGAPLDEETIDETDCLDIYRVKKNLIDIPITQEYDERLHELPHWEVEEALELYKIRHHIKLELIPYSTDETMRQALNVVLWNFGSENKGGLYAISK